MRQVAAALMWVLWSGIAAAEWTPVVASDDIDVYADTSTIRVAGGAVKMWVLENFRKARSFDGKRFQSSKAQQEFDCRSRRLKGLALTLYSDAMAGGAAIYSTPPGIVDNWQPVPQEGIMEALWKLACK